MGISQETYDQVKNILRKLDRSIDQARTERIHGSRAPEGSGRVQDKSELIGGSESAPPRPGRARPMVRRPDQNGGTNHLATGGNGIG